MTLFTYGTLFGAVIGTFVGFLAAAMCSVAAHADDLESIEQWQRRQRCLRTEVSDRG